MNKKTLLLLFAMLAATSCERAFMPQNREASPTEVFDYLWQQVDRQYSMFDVKNVDWQTVYDILRPKVADDITGDSLFRLCATMLGTLHDGHVNLYNGYDIAHSDSIVYLFYAESQIDINAVVLGYLGTAYHTTGGIAHQGIADGKVAYLRYSSFSSGISTAQLRHILRSYPDAQGAILDIRGNGGGSIVNIHNILSILPSHGQLLYSSQIKAGPDHDDFTTLQPTFAPQPSPDDTSLLWGKPLIVLTDRGCFSAASMFSLCCRAYPNVLLLGDTTAGGLGLPSTAFLPNGWRYRLSVTRLLSPEGDNFENGVPPHRILTLDRQSALTAHHDNIIDSACSIILNH